MATEVNKILLDIEVDAKGVITNLDQVQSKLKSVGVDLAKAGKQFQDFSKGAKDGASAAGIAGAAAAELGRTISDLPFGLTAITNNVSQLGSMFSLLVVKTGTVKKALGELLDVFKGPAGYLIIFQIAVAAVELFSQRQNKAKKEVDQLNLELEAQAEVLREIIRLKEEGAITSDDEERLLNNYVKINKELVKLSKEGVISEKEKSDILKEYLRLFELRRADDKDQIDRDARRKTLAEEIVKLEAKRESIAKDLNNDIRLNAVGQFEIEAVQRRINGITEEIRLKESQILDISFDEAEKKSEIGAIEDEINKKIDDTVKKKERLLEIEKQRVKALSDLLDVQISEEQQGVDQAVLEQDEEKFLRHYSRLLELKQEQLSKQRDEELKDVEDQTVINAVNAKYEILFNKLGKDFSLMFIEGMENIGKDITSMDIDSLYDFGKDSYTSFKKGFTDKFIDEGYEGFFDVFKPEEADPYFPFIDLLKFESELELETEEENKKKSIAKRQEKLDAILNMTSSGLTAINDVLSAQAEREIAIETNKTNSLNDQLKQRLANEQLSAEERDRINQQIAKNEAALVEKENAINKRRFDQQKAFSIAMAVVDTFVAANQALRDTTLVTTFAKVAAMISIIGTGLANVASIAKQKFTAKAMPSPNLSAQGVGAGVGAEPQFNVIGATGQNQLAAAISGVQQQPVRAYVVSNEVTTAQSLDRNIVAEASL